MDSAQRRKLRRAQKKATIPTVKPAPVVPAVPTAHAPVAPREYRPTFDARTFQNRRLGARGVPTTKEEVIAFAAERKQKAAAAGVTREARDLAVGDRVLVPKHVLRYSGRGLGTVHTSGVFGTVIDLDMRERATVQLDGWRTVSTGWRTGRYRDERRKNGRIEGVLRDFQRIDTLLIPAMLPTDVCPSCAGTGGKRTDCTWCSGAGHVTAERAAAFRGRRPTLIIIDDCEPPKPRRVRDRGL